jgi:hypothetical protein
VINVYATVNGSPVLAGQVVLWDHDVAPTDPWLPIAAAFYVADWFYDHEDYATGETSWDQGSPEPLAYYDAESAPELVRMMLSPLMGNIDGAAELMEHPATY